MSNSKSDAATKLKAALSKLSTSPNDYKPLTTAAKNFGQEAKAYFYLKAYVVAGKDFPANEADFNRKIPEDAFKELSLADSEIHQETKDALTKIGSACTLFYQHNLFQMIEIGNTTVSWCNATLRMLKRAEKFNLYNQLMVMVDPKNQKTSEAWKSAHSGAVYNLKKLSNEAESSRIEINKIRDALQQFYNDTKDVKPKVENLVIKYQKGPVTSTVTNNKPYLEYMSQGIVEKVTKIQELNKKANDKMDELTDKPKDFRTWLTLLSPVGGLQLLSDAKEILDAVKELKKQSAQQNKEKANEAALVQFVTTMLVQFEDILGKISNALKAIATLSDMFNNQGRTYKEIGKVLVEMATDANSDLVGDNLKDAIEDNLKATIGEIEKLHDMAAGFATAILKEPTNA